MNVTQIQIINILTLSVCFITCITHSIVLKVFLMLFLAPFSISFLHFQSRTVIPGTHGGILWSYTLCTCWACRVYWPSCNIPWDLWPCSPGTPVIRVSNFCSRFSFVCVFSRLQLVFVSVPFSSLRCSVKYNEFPVLLWVSMMQNSD